MTDFAFAQKSEIQEVHEVKMVKGYFRVQKLNRWKINYDWNLNPQRRSIRHFLILDAV